MYTPRRTKLQFNIIFEEDPVASARNICFDLTLFSKINTCCTNNDVTYIIMPRIAQESSVYLFPFISILFKYLYIFS